VLRRDQPALQGLLTGWDVCVAHDGALTPWERGDWLEGARHQFWVRRPDNDAWSFEVLLEEAREDTWVYRRDTRIEMPLSRFGRTSAGRLPYVAPEVALLYKAKWHDLDRNAADFAVAAPLLDAEARAWLRDALHRSAPGHPWIRQLP
jgi:hypothetical protein